jgi:hypothetical protein
MGAVESDVLQPMLDGTGGGELESEQHWRCQQQQHVQKQQKLTLLLRLLPRR